MLKEFRRRPHLETFCGILLLWIFGLLSFLQPQISCDYLHGGEFESLNMRFND